MSKAIDTLTLRMPDDCHLHLREGETLQLVLPDTLCRFQRAVVMPNLSQPVVSTKKARHYHAEILRQLPSGHAFQPLMTLYLTEHTSAAEIDEAKDSGLIVAVKYYPANVTTNAEHGVRDIALCYTTLEKMIQLNMPLLVHAEYLDATVDVFDRETVFIDRILAPLCYRYPELRIVVEHVSSRYGVDFVREQSEQVAATITAHHLWWTRNDLFDGGLRPHRYCLPVVKTESDQAAIRAAAVSGSPKFFLGTDSAPHHTANKECQAAAAGIYSALGALEWYATFFAQADALEKLEDFAAVHGAQFYGLALNTKTITLEKQEWCVPNVITTKQGQLTPFKAGEICPWQLQKPISN